MRELAGNPTLLPPQVFNDDIYCGDFEAFERKRRVGFGRAERDSLAR